MSIYQQQRQLVRKSIVETALRLFETRGYEQTSVAAITQEVGIAKGTFYNHFENKSDISSKDFNTAIENKLDLRVDVLNNSLFAGIVNYFREFNTSDGLEQRMVDIVSICLFGICSVDNE